MRIFTNTHRRHSPLPTAPRRRRIGIRSMKALHSLCAGIACVCLLCSAACSRRAQTIRQKRRDLCVDVRDRIREVPQAGSLMLGSTVRLFAVDDRLLVLDATSNDRLIHIFDVRDLRCLGSRIRRGRGPGEIVIPGDPIVDAPNRRFLLPDHGRLLIYGYDIDSLLADPDYRAGVAMEMQARSFPVSSAFVDERRLIGVIVEPEGSNSFRQRMASWDIASGEIVPMSYEHPKIERRRIGFAVSPKDDLYVEVYRNHDLLTFCSLDGTLKYNVYGPRWNRAPSNAVSYFGKAQFCRDKLVVAYSGGDNRTEERHPTRLMVFDRSGRYLKTLETGYKICDFCYDEVSGRLFFSLDAEIQLAWMDAGDLL